MTVTSDDGCSTVTDQFSQVPLQLHRPLYLEGASFPTVYIKTPSSGLLEGDDHQIDITVENDSKLELRTQAATLVYPGRSTLSMFFKIKKGGQLIFLPHPIILGAESYLQQKVKIDMEDGASLCFSDTWCAGRIAMNELFRFLRYNYLLEITQDKKMLYREQWSLIPGQMPVSHPLLCGDFTHFSSLYKFGEAIPGSNAFAETLKEMSYEIGQNWSLERNGNTIERRAFRVDTTKLTPN